MWGTFKKLQNDMQEQIIVYMVVRNVSQRRELFESVVSAASEISHSFFIVDHGSNDNSLEIIKNLEKKLSINVELQKELFEGTMDEMKGKYYIQLQQKYGTQEKYIFILDWDELLDDSLIREINQLKMKYDVYLINRHTYLINKVIDRNSYLPLLFKVNSVVISPIETFHKLYDIKSRNCKKLKSPLHHFSYESVDSLIEKNIMYARKEAQVLYDISPSISNFSLFFRYIYEGTLYFLFTFFYHYNFLNLEGFLYSINWYVYKYYKYLFYLEIKNKNEK